MPEDDAVAWQGLSPRVFFRDGKLMGRVDDEWVDWQAEEF